MSVSEFEPMLKDVVQSKRLSASKITKLTELTMKCLEHDTQMVSCLYRSHKSLPSSFKISSLYVFDALARAAKSRATKQGLSLDASYPTGNAATFLAKLAGVVEGLFKDMLSSDIPEGKTKTKKIMDIWVKGSTFPAEVMSSLSEIIEGKKKEPEPSSIPNPTPENRVASQSTPPVVTPPVLPSYIASPAMPDVNPQAALLALLAQAANTVIPNLQTHVNTQPAPLAAAAAQLAVLHQLTNTSAAPVVSNVSLHTLTSAPQGNSYVPGQNRSSRSPIPDDPRRPNRVEYRRERQFSPEAGRSHDSRNDYRSYSRDPRPNPRGDSRGDPRGEPRGRGGGDRRRRDDRNDRDYTGRDRDRARNARRSRSRSPPNTYTDKRTDRVFSPRVDGPAPSNWPTRTGTAANKDEFGRDVRAPSPEPGPKATIQQPQPTSAQNPVAFQYNLPDSPTTSTSNKHDADHIPAADVAPNTSSDVSFDSNTHSSQQGMDNFDFSTFDLRSPASWEALGKMWQVTYGCLPTDEQLMQFVMALTMGAAQPVAQAEAGQGQWEGSDEASGGRGWGGNGRGRGTGTRGYARGGRGRGGFHGNGRESQRDWSYDDYSSSNNDTDAIVLGGGDDDSQYNTAVEDPRIAAAGGGKTQKINGKWGFAREDDSYP
ncbi:hypothetical protein FA15DRAFT_663853 [Coprinopsis marcescibilis]|uniref:CID domain-containing protein n=1 Tax=Coprinopsis marcescibilis TaxID=230819 RepID=A0A5C3L9H5_COPMA|nr:hypothetical protein FA15DRAFT_663853 [Coprinopsis marcescibilis]